MKFFDKMLYMTWAPDRSEWAAWAKPVLFAGGFHDKNVEVDIPDIEMPFDRKAMIIVDMPGKRSVEEALAFASRGWQPVPLYNGVLGSGKMLIDIRELCAAIRNGAPELREMSIADDAPPVFMLDANRMMNSKQPGFYDNRWCVFPQDMPSAEFLLSKGIDKIIVRCAHKDKEAFGRHFPVRMDADLNRILYEYQKVGIGLFYIGEGSGSPRETSAGKQTFFEELAYRFKITLGLRRNATGGFGGLIPDPEVHAGSGMVGGRPYGFG